MGFRDGRRRLLQGRVPRPGTLRLAVAGSGHRLRRYRGCRQPHLRTRHRTIGAVLTVSWPQIGLLNARQTGGLRVDRAYDELKTALSEVQDLRTAAQLMEWDQQTMMPPRGAATRAEQLGTLRRLVHERFLDARIGNLLDRLAAH